VDEDRLQRPAERAELLRCLSNILNSDSEQWTDEVAKLHGAGFMDPKGMVDRSSPGS